MLETLEASLWEVQDRRVALLTPLLGGFVSLPAFVA